MQKMKPDNFAVRRVLDNKSLEKGMDLLACVCAPPASEQPKKKTSHFAQPEIKVQTEVKLQA